MKYLYGIAFISLALLFACGEKENIPKGGSKSVDLISAISPDSALLHVDTAHLYALRDSNLALYEQSKQQEHYQQAVRYNAQYRLYNDSILQVQRNRELADVRAAYDYEKLTGDQNQLALEKIEIQTMWMTVLAVCLCIGGGALLFYQRGLIRKERAIREAKRHLQELTEQIALNQRIIRSNENLIQTINGQLKGLPRPVTPEEGRQLMDETEEIHSGFVEDLHRTFPNLSDLDILACCLVKLNFTTSEIAVIMGVDVASVSKRKLRMKEHMREAKQ
jgi:hypothetical protein